MKATCAARCRTSPSRIRSRSTTTTRSGAPSTTATGPRITSSTPNGRIRGHHFGEGEYDESERLIRRLLQDAGQTNLPPPVSAVAGDGVQSAADNANIASPETYVGYGRAESFSSPGGFAHDASKDYALPGELQRNQWALAGSWTVSPENARTRCRRRPDQLPVPCARPASRAGPGESRPSDPLSRDARRPGAGKGQRCRHRRERRRRRARTAPVPAHPPVGRRSRSHVHHRIPRRRRRSVCIHLRLTPHRQSHEHRSSPPLPQAVSPEYARGLRLHRLREPARRRRDAVEPGAQQHRHDRELFGRGRERGQRDRRAGRQDRRGMAQAPVAGFLSHHSAIGHRAALSPASTTRNTVRASIAASAATRRSSTPRRSSIPAPAGRVSGRRSRAPIRSRVPATASA